MKPWLLIPIVGFLNNTNRMDGGSMDRLWTRFQREKEVERERDGA